MGIENGIRHDPFESCALIASDGRVLATSQGHNSHVTLTAQQLLMSAGATFTHNHPGGTGPSASDVDNGLACQLHEVRVVTASQRHMIWPLDRTKAFAVQAEYDSEIARVEVVLRDEVRRNQLHPKDFGRELVHRTWQRLSVKFGFHYRREDS